MLFEPWRLLWFKDFRTKPSALFFNLATNTKVVILYKMKTVKILRVDVYWKENTSLPSKQANKNIKMKLIHKSLWDERRSSFEKQNNSINVACGRMYVYIRVERGGDLYMKDDFIKPYNKYIWQKQINIQKRYKNRGQQVLEMVSIVLKSFRWNQTELWSFWIKIKLNLWLIAPRGATPVN